MLYLQSIIKKKESSIYKIIKKHKSDLIHLYILKCKVFITFFKEQRSLKLNAKFWQGIHIKYKGNNQYYIYSSVTKCTDVY